MLQSKECAQVKTAPNNACSGFGGTLRQKAESHQESFFRFVS